MVLTYGDTEQRTGLTSFGIGLSGSDYYGRDDEAYRAGRLIQLAGLLEREQLRKLSATAAPATVGLLGRILRAVDRRLVGELGFELAEAQVAPQTERNVSRLMPWA
jgi:hypothetical protein